MKRIAYHVTLPAIMPILFFIVASTPVEVLGCAVRGLIALLIALISGLAALVAVIIGLKGRVRHDNNSSRWLISGLILVVPVVAIIILG
jgi:hypothetical protein